MKRGPLGRWWNFSMPRPPLLCFQNHMVQENWYLSHIWQPGSWTLLSLLDSDAVDLLTDEYSQLHVPLHSLKLVHLDPLTVGSPSTTGAFFFCLIDISPLQQSPCHKHSMFLDHLDFTKWNKKLYQSIYLFHMHYENELYTVLMHEKKKWQGKRKSYGGVLKSSKSTVHN